MRGPRGGVACDHPLAAGAGMQVLREGGSAADAAIAMAAVMVVVQPQYSHLGGDSFAVCWDQQSGDVTAMNSSGPAPVRLDPETYRKRGSISINGVDAVTVPGCVDGWSKLHERYGRRPWARLFDDAIAIAGDGFPASRGFARAVAAGRERIYPADFFRSVFGAVAGDGGQGVRQPALARTLQAIQADNASGFYEGDVATACLSALNGRGARFVPEDWTGPARWYEPLSVRFGDVTVHTQPPPSRGLILPLALRAYERANPSRGSPVEAFKATVEAFSVVNTYAGDPDVTAFDAAATLRTPPAPSLISTMPRDGDTTYILAIDEAGNAVSFIQSIFAPWGSGVFVPETGVLMNNRMCGFVLAPGHPNEIAPGKRPMHTLHSYLATAGDVTELPMVGAAASPATRRLAIVGGTPGADRQPQTNLQVLDGIVNEGLDPQDALDRPRWSTSPTDPGAVEVETRSESDLGAAFVAGGLRVIEESGWRGKFGRAFVATVSPSGVAIGSDLRGEGTALVY